MILIALGANIPSRFGTPEATLEAAKAALCTAGISIVASSRTWLTAPVPVSDQEWYRNAVVKVETDMDAFSLIRALKAIERDFGRVSAERNTARILDLDLLAYNNEVHNTEHVIVPHARMEVRAFVILPLMEIAPEWVHPVLGKTTAELLKILPPRQEARPLEAKAA